METEGLILVVGVLTCVVYSLLIQSTVKNIQKIVKKKGETHPEVLRLRKQLKELQEKEHWVRYEADIEPSINVAYKNRGSESDK